jgi:hypothetical protein
MLPLASRFCSHFGDWQASLIYQWQSGFPFTVSVFGDTANAGSLLNVNPIRANVVPGVSTPEIHVRIRVEHPRARAQHCSFHRSAPTRNRHAAPDYSCRYRRAPRDIRSASNGSETQRSQPLSVRGLPNRPSPFYFDSIVDANVTLDIYGTLVPAPEWRYRNLNRDSQQMGSGGTTRQWSTAIRSVGYPSEAG